MVWPFTVLPTLLKERGVSDNLIERILTHSPRRAFAFATVSKTALNAASEDSSPPIFPFSHWPI